MNKTTYYIIMVIVASCVSMAIHGMTGNIVALILSAWVSVVLLCGIWVFIVDKNV